MTRQDLVFIESPATHFGNEQLPNARRTAGLHRMAAAVPEIEIAHHADTRSIRRPDGKACSSNPFALFGMGSQDAIDTVVITFAEQMQIEIAQRSGKVVSIVAAVRAAIVIADAEPIGHGRPTQLDL